LIVTLAGETFTTAGLLLARFTVTPPLGAGAGRVTWNGAVCPSATVTFEGSDRAPAEVTDAVAVAPVTLGAVTPVAMVAVPVPTPVTETFAVVLPCGIVTEAGTETIPAGVAVSGTVSPPVGAAADKVNNSVLVSDPVRFKVWGEKLSEAPTVTA